MRIKTAAALSVGKKWLKNKLNGKQQSGTSPELFSRMKKRDRFVIKETK